MKTLLILFLSLISLLSYSQTKDYYKKDGIIKPKTRSASSIQYKCKVSYRVPGAEIWNINNKLNNKSTQRKDNAERPEDCYLIRLVTLNDPEIVHKIVAKAVKKHSLEVYTKEEIMQDNSHRKSNTLRYLSIHIYYNSDNAEVLEVKFRFPLYEEDYASSIPIETYEEIEKEIKKQAKATITEEGKTLTFCIKWACIYFKDKK